jgi:hypothetical protein
MASSDRVGGLRLQLIRQRAEERGIVARRPGNTLEKWEVALVKAMLRRNTYRRTFKLTFQGQLAQSNTHVFRRFATELRHKGIKAASEDELDNFLEAWPDIDPKDRTAPAR